MNRLRNYVIGSFLIFIHAGALLAFMPQFFSWSAVEAALLLYYLTGGLGVCLTYHRILTHRSLRVPKLLEYALTVLAVLSLQGGPIEWVATHRAHHAHTDKEGDPHSIYDGLLWTHLEWMYRSNPHFPIGEQQARLTPDLSNDPFYRFIEKTHALWQIPLAGLLFYFGGWSWVIWAVFVRLVVTYHGTWLVNSAAHAVGYQSYRTGDKSRNNWFVAMFSWGEGWHNNHHAFPSSARHGMTWYEVDITWMTVRFLQFIRLARDVRVPTPAMLERLRIRDSSPE